MKGPRPKSPEIRFWAKVKKTAGCWLWTASRKGPKGKDYGQFHDGERLVSAHRYSWRLHHKRRIPSGMCVCHRCDVRICVKPGHLFLGTVADNNHDMYEKRRGNHARGDVHFRAKLSSADVREIRARYRPYKNSVTLAKKFDVNPACILKVVNRKTWAHL